MTYIFPVKTCTRCAGTGRHSYNSLDGDRCYGCSGTGVQSASKKSAEFEVVARELKRGLQLPTAINVNVGDFIRFTKDGEWSEVVENSFLEKESGRGSRGGVVTVYHYRHIVLADGTEHDVPDHLQIRRRLCQWQWNEIRQPLKELAFASLTKAQKAEHDRIDNAD